MGTRKRLVLLTGATGYIGGRLLKELENRGYPVRCLARRAEYLISRVGPATRVVRGDVFDPASIREVLDGVHAAYYLVHSLGGKGSFEDDNRTAARNFGQAAREAGVKRIIKPSSCGLRSSSAPEVCPSRWSAP
jgi:uncharacterized protein YbjT (DUF2867 family)